MRRTSPAPTSTTSSTTVKRTRPSPMKASCSNGCECGLTSIPGSSQFITISALSPRKPARLTPGRTCSRGNSVQRYTRTLSPIGSRSLSGEIDELPDQRVLAGPFLEDRFHPFLHRLEVLELADRDALGLQELGGLVFLIPRMLVVHADRLMARLDDCLLHVLGQGVELRLIHDHDTRPEIMAGEGHVLGVLVKALGLYRGQIDFHGINGVGLKPRIDFAVGHAYRVGANGFPGPLVQRDRYNTRLLATEVLDCPNLLGPAEEMPQTGLVEAQPLHVLLGKTVQHRSEEHTSELQSREKL